MTYVHTSHRQQTLSVEVQVKTEEVAGYFPVSSETLSCNQTSNQVFCSILNIFKFFMYMTDCRKRNCNAMRFSLSCFASEIVSIFSLPTFIHISYIIQDFIMEEKLPILS